MTDDEREAAVRERLAKAPPPPWEIDPRDQDGAIYHPCTDKLGNPDARWICGAMDEDAAPLIENAPVDLAFLLARLDVERARVKKWRAVGRSCVEPLEAWGYSAARTIRRLLREVT